MNKVVKACFASVVSELQQSDIFMTVKARLFETPKANLNGVRTTSAFLNEIVENEEKYVGLPLVADVNALATGRYDHLGHLYDARTGQFHTTQIGSFYKFEREDFDGGSYLVGYARVAKRNKALCRALAELFSEGALKFSFEISCGEYEELDDGTMVIDASENNYLEGTAIVTFPACEDAVALELVAECDRIADDLRKGEQEMTDVNESAEVVEKETTEEAQAEALEEEASCKKKKCADEESEQAEEMATVYVTERKTETEAVSMYDTENATDITQTTINETIVSKVIPDAMLVAEDGDGGEGAGSGGTSESNGESGENSGGSGSGDNNGSGAQESEEETEEEFNNTEETQKKKTAEEMVAELSAVVEQLKVEIAEIKQKQNVIAEKHTEAIHPFTAEISLPVKKYSLLEKAEKTSNYSLLEKA